MDMTNLWRPFLSYNMQHDIAAFELAKSKFQSKVLFDTPAVVGTLEFMQRLSKTFAPGFLEKKGFETFGTPDNNVGVYLDRMVLDNWRTNQGTGTLDRYGYAPYPKRSDGQGRAFFLGDWNMAIPKNSPNPKAAWEFIRWLITDTRVADYIIDTGNIPNSKTGLDALMKSGIPFADAINETFRDFPEFFWAASSKYYDNLFGPLESVFGAHITSLYSGNITAAQAARNIQKEMDEFAASNR
jgi:ABC-type glycerol-3-phosphate transport system substrate-binding protein